MNTEPNNDENKESVPPFGQPSEPPVTDSTAESQSFNQPTAEQNDQPITQTQDPFSQSTEQPAFTTAPTETPASDVPPFAFAPQTPAPEATTQLAPPKKRKKPLLVAGIIVTAVLILLGGGSALAYNVWYQNPDKVIGDALVNALTAETISATTTVDIKSDDYTLNLKLNGRTSADSHGFMAVTMNYKAEGVEVAVDGEGIFSADGDLYVKLNKAQELADSIAEQPGGAFDFSMFDTVIEKIDGNWVKISSEDLGTYSEEYKKSQKCLDEYSESLNADKALRESVTNEVTELFKANRFILITESLGSKEVNGVGSLGYKLGFDTEKSKTFVSGLDATQLGKKLKECDNSIDFKTLAEDIEVDEQAPEVATEVWVSRFGHEFTEMNIAFSQDGTGATIVVNPSFNTTESITIPEASVTLTELQADIEKAYEEYFTQYYSDAYNIDYTDDMMAL